MTKPGRRIVHCNDELATDLVAFRLGSEKRTRRGQIGADRGDLRKTAHAGLFAGRDQRHHAAPMDGIEAVTRAVLQRACRIHDRIHTRNHRQPIFSGKQSGHVGRDPAHRWPASLRLQNIAAKAGHIVTVAQQTADDGLADQTIAAENKNLHAVTFRLPPAQPSPRRSHHWPWKHPGHRPGPCPAARRRPAHPVPRRPRAPDRRR